MKKYLSILLCAMILATILCAPYVLAENLEPPATPDAPAPATYTVNLTGLIVAILVAFFEFLLAWLLKAVIPPLKSWLAVHTTEKQRRLIWDAVCKLVEAAEQIIKGPGLGERRMAYVKAGLEERGYTVDTDMIEAAVKRMNDRAAWEISHALEIGTDVELDEDDEKAGDDNRALS